MLNGTKLALLSACMIVSAVASTPTYAQDYDPFTQCLKDYCFGHYVNDPAGYRACWQWCAGQTGGPYVTTPQPSGHRWP